MPSLEVIVDRVLPLLVATGLAACSAAPPPEPIRAAEPCPGASWDSLDVADASFDTRSDTARRQIIHPSNREYPHFPPALRAPGARGEVIASFVIDTSGNVVRASRAIVSATARPYGEAVCDFLAKAAFAPLQIDGRVARVKVTMPFAFEIR